MTSRKRSAPGSRGRNLRTSSRKVLTTSDHGDVPDVVRQMLREAHVGPEPDDERPRKRKRPGEGTRAVRKEVLANADPEVSDEEDLEFEDVQLPAPTIQTAERDSDESSEEDEEQLEFQDVDFSFPDINAGEEPGPKTIELDLSAHVATPSKAAVDRRKPFTRFEKDRRVDVHKLHVLCLLAHVARRNRWCNDPIVQGHLRPLLTSKMTKYLNPGLNLSQFGRTESLKNGLQQVSHMFKSKFQVTERGMQRALWAEDEDDLKDYELPEDMGSPMDKSEFREAAKSLSGSRDVGAQLFCALLRTAGVEARLVCSLQPLSFTSGGPMMSRSKGRKSKSKLSAAEQRARMPKYDNSYESPTKSLVSPSAARRRLGHPNAAAFNVPIINEPTSSRAIMNEPKKIHSESPYPVYWVEVLDVAHQKWQPVDALVLNSFWKPRLFEPPASDQKNSMTYVIGFEADGSARDVTRRYAKAYNAKTRRQRIESARDDGERWWRKALRPYRHLEASDLNQIEDNEMTANETREPMPRNVADFKDHPIYALERHLRRSEVLLPDAKSSGTVGAGSKGPLEKIYRRRDVRIARSREKWYRMGREVKFNEIPVKFLPKPKKKVDSITRNDKPDHADGETAGTPVYTIEQTELYIPPPVINGRIRKNKFGNIDVYVPSMVPDGGVHIADENAARAAFILGIDYAPALAGFSFKGRHGTAVLNGVVVAADYAEAVRVVIEGLKELEQEIELERKSRRVLKAWRRMIMELRVRQRIWAGVGSEERAQDTQDGPSEIDKGNARSGVDDDDRPVERDAEYSDDSDAMGGFIVDDDYAGGFVIE